VNKKVDTEETTTIAVKIKTHNELLDIKHELGKVCSFSDTIEHLLHKG
jgi:predicted CopG family antitoxin